MSYWHQTSIYIKLQNICLEKLSFFKKKQKKNTTIVISYIIYIIYYKNQHATTEKKINKQGGVKVQREAN